MDIREDLKRPEHDTLSPRAAFSKARRTALLRDHKRTPLPHTLEVVHIARPGGFAHGLLDLGLCLGARGEQPLERQVTKLIAGKDL